MGNIGKNTHHIRAWVSETVRFYESVKVNNPRMGNGRSPSAMLVLWNVTEPCTVYVQRSVVWSAAHTPRLPDTGYWHNCATLPPSEVKMDSNITQQKTHRHRWNGGVSSRRGVIR